MWGEVERIPTTHTGSLPRPPELVALLQAGDQGQPVSQDERRVRTAEAVRKAVEGQIGAGIDVVNDGEQGKPSYTTYVKDRLTGFGGEGSYAEAADRADFPEFNARFREESAPDRRPAPPLCVGPVGVADPRLVEQDIENLSTALGGRRQGAAFITAVSPGQIARSIRNAYYPSDEAYLAALADVMRDEYQAVAAAGFLLQVDCPDLAAGRSTQFAHLSLREFRKVAELHVEVLNHALASIPPEQLRIHLCWGNYEGPHHRDVPLRDIIDIVFRARPSAILFEAANPRHDHEWKVFEEIELPDGKLLVPGVIDSTTNYIEHPEVVGQRIVRLARLVGRENVAAGTDCGFADYAGKSVVDARIAWAKLRAMSDGAALASKELW